MGKGKVGAASYLKANAGMSCTCVYDHVNDWYDEVIADEQTGKGVRERRARMS
jgi:hypothetical protein